jgi:hypothetical protein
LEQARSASTLIGRDLAGLGGVANSIKAGAALEQAGAGNRLREAQAAALTDMSVRRVQAREGEQFATQNARRALVGELQKIFERSQSLGRERGAFTAATARQLREAATERATRVAIERMGNESAAERQALDLAQSERNSQRSAGLDPDTGRPIPGGRLDPRGRRGRRRVQWAPPATQGRVQDQLGVARRYVQDLRRDGASRADIARQLVQGVPATLVDTGRKDANGQPVKVRVPAIPKVPELVASVALDQELNGHLSRENQQRLHRRGIRIRDLGVTSRGEYEQRRRRPSRPPLAPGARGQQRPT